MGEMHEFTMEELKEFAKSSLAILSAKMGAACICGVHTTSQAPEARFVHTQAHFDNEFDHMMVCPHGILFTIAALQQHLTSHDPDWSQWMPHALLHQASGAVEPSIQENPPILHSDDEEVVDLVIRRSKKGSGPSQVTLLSLSKYFHLTLKDAAKAMKVSVTSLKKASRKLGILRWPGGRKFRSLDTITRGVHAMRERLGVKETKEILHTLLKVESKRKGTRDELRCAMVRRLHHSDHF